MMSNKEAVRGKMAEVLGHSPEVTTDDAVLTDLQIIGRENLPAGGPLLVVANHFSYIDPVAMVRVVPWPLELQTTYRCCSTAPIRSFHLRDVHPFYGRVRKRPQMLLKQWVLPQTV